MDVQIQLNTFVNTTLYKMEDLDFTEVPLEAAKALSSAFSSADSKEARKAYLEKRKPRWTGK